MLTILWKKTVQSTKAAISLRRGKIEQKLSLTTDCLYKVMFEIHELWQNDMTLNDL